MNREEKQEQIEKRIKEIYDMYAKIPEEETESQTGKLENITYYEDFTLIQPKQGMGIAEQDIYIVRKVNEQQRVLYDIYNDNMLIATVDENGNIQFEQSYIEMLKQIDARFSTIAEKENNIAKLELPEELSEEDKVVTAEELASQQEDIENKKENTASEEDKEQIEEEQEEPKGEEEELEEIASVCGIDVRDITSHTEIDPSKLVTENESFEEIAGIEGKYEKIKVVNANANTGNSRFSFIGITSDGTAEKIEELQTRGTMQTEKSIYSIDRNGSTVEEKQTTEMFATGDKNKMFSVTVGDYGTIDVDYIRRSEKDNKFIGAPVETRNQMWASKEVQQFMNESRTTREGIEQVVDRVEHQTEENQSEQTNLNNIDNNPNNDKALDYDTIIELHNGEETTLRKEAMKTGKTPEQYAELFESAKGDCAAEKIVSVNSEIQAEQDEERAQEHFGREERLTPSELAEMRAALKKQNNNENE